MAELQLEELVDSMLAYEPPAEIEDAKEDADRRAGESEEPKTGMGEGRGGGDKVSTHVRTSLLLLHREVTGQLLELPPAEEAPRRAATPLICDASVGERSHKHFLRASDKYAVLDAKKMHLDLNVKKLPLAHILESARTTVAHAMRTGRVLVLRMGDVTVDFLNTFNDASAVKLTAKQLLNKVVLKETSAPYHDRAFLPLEIFRDKGHLLREEAWANKLYSRADREELHRDPVKKGFAVIVTTTYPEDCIDAYVFTGAFGLPPRGLFHIRTFK